MNTINEQTNIVHQKQWCILGTQFTIHFMLENIIIFCSNIKKAKKKCGFIQHECIIMTNL